MLTKKDSILTLLKSASGTIGAAGLSLTGPKNPGEDDTDITLEGELGDVTLKTEDNVLSILCRKGDEDFKCVSQTLFDCESENWDVRDVKSAANEVAEAISGFFGTDLVPDTQDTKTATKGKNGKGKAEMTPEIEEFLEKGQKKKAKKESTITYEPENLANRMENIFTDVKGELDNNIAKYEIFLPEEYFETFITPRVMQAIRTEDKPILKKVFNAFNIFYDEGENDVQSLIAVSILGVEFAKEDGLLEKCESYMSETLLGALLPIIKYLTSNAGKKKAEALKNPKPYVPKRRNPLKK